MSSDIPGTLRIGVPAAIILVYACQHKFTIKIYFNLQISDLDGFSCHSNQDCANLLGVYGDGRQARFVRDQVLLPQF